MATVDLPKHKSQICDLDFKLKMLPPGQLCNIALQVPPPSIEDANSKLTTRGDT